MSVTKSWPVTAPGSQGVFRGRGRGVEKKEMTFRQVTKEEKGPNIAVRSPIAEKRRRESEEKEKVKVGF
jgi:hypothetical protein